MRAYPSVTAHVIGADGALTGFGAGLEWKRWLLAVENPERWGEGRL